MTSSRVWPVVAPEARTPSELLATWSAMAERAYAANTLRAWRADWAVFESYCRRHALDALPAAALTVRAFAFDCMGTGKRPATIRRYLATIARAHRAAKLENPADSEPVRLAMKEIGRALTTRQRQARALGWSEIEQFLQREPVTLRDHRDRAFIAVAYDTLARREELVELWIEDIARSDDGSGTVLIRRAKNDPSGEGASAWLAPSTVALVDTWLRAASLQSGPLFRHVRRGDRVGASLHRDSVAGIVKRIGKAIGFTSEELAQLSGHSTRVGAAQDLLALDIELPALMQAGRWKDTRMPMRYGERVLASKGAMARAAKRQGR